MKQPENEPGGNVTLPGEAEQHQSVRTRLDIVYEDEYLLVVWKPSGLAVHSSGSSTKETLCDQVVKYLSAAHAYPVGRLDQEAAGFMVLGKNHLIASMPGIERSQGQIHKKYLAFCHGSWNTHPVILPNP